MRAFVLLVSMSLVAGACGDDDGESADTVAGSAAPGTTVAETNETAPDTTVAVTGEPAPDTTAAASDESDSCTADRVGGEMIALTNIANSGLDPALLQGTGARGGDIAAAFYGTVINYDATTDTYEPNIAESWEPNEDNTVWTLRLRDDVTFGNGDQFTTEHVQAHLARLAATQVRAAGMAALVTGIEIVDDFEMVVTLSSPFDFPYMMASEPGWVPNNNLVVERGEGFHVNPIGAGAGAFEFESVSTTPGESLVLRAKDDWWGGPVCIDRIEFRNIPVIETQTDAFLNGEADVLFVGDQVQAAELEEQGLMAYEVGVGALGYVTANQGFAGEETAFDDIRIREAMQLAIDYDTLHERLFDGLGPSPSSALVPEDSPLWSGIDGPPYDPDRAAALVQETVGEGVWDGSFTFTHGSPPDQVETAVLLEAMWEAVGLDVTLESTADAAVRVIVERNFETATLGFSILPPEPWTTLNGLACDSPRSRSGFCDPDMDAALTAVKEAVSLDEKREAMAQVQEAWNRTFPLVNYRHGTWGIAAQPHVQGLEFGVDATPHFEHGWIEG